MANILTELEGAAVLRCDENDQNMLDLLPQVDGYIQYATGRDWTVDSPIRAEAKAAARMLLVRWHEDPGGMGAGGALGYGLAAALMQLEALALQLRTAGTPDEPLILVNTNIDGYMAVDARFVLAFNYPMDPGSTARVHLVGVTTTNTLDVSGRILTITPLADLAHSASYILMIDYAPDIYGRTLYREIAIITAG